MTVAAPRATPGQRSERERGILDVAAVAFHEKGFHGVGVDEIGRRAGLSGPAIYRHFAGKDELLASLLDEAMDELLSAVDTTDDPQADLDRAVRHHLNFALEEHQLVGLYHREARFLADPWNTAFARRVVGYTRAWEQLITRVAPSASPHDVTIATQTTLGLVFSLPGWPERVRLLPHVEDVVEAQLYHGLDALEHARPPGG